MKRRLEVVSGHTHNRRNVYSCYFWSNSMSKKVTFTVLGIFGHLTRSFSVIFIRSCKQASFYALSFVPAQMNKKTIVLRSSLNLWNGLF